MSYEFFNLSLIGGTFLTGIAIRLLDDYIDRQQDELLGRASTWHYLQGASLVYAMVALALGLRLVPLWGSALFFGAYAIGMLSDPNSMLPSHLSGGLEFLIAAILAFLAGGVTLGLAALSLMLGVDIIDDCLDYASECKIVSVRNWAALYGKGPALFLGILALISSLSLAKYEAGWGIIFSGLFLFYSWQREG